MNWIQISYTKAISKAILFIHNIDIVVRNENVEQEKIIEEELRSGKRCIVFRKMNTKTMK